MKLRLKKNIVIKAGTIFDTAPHTISCDPSAFVECTFGLTKGTFGTVRYHVGDDNSMLDPKYRRAIHRWFEKVK